MSSCTIGMHLVWPMESGERRLVFFLSASHKQPFTLFFICILSLVHYVPLFTCFAAASHVPPQMMYAVSWMTSLVQQVLETSKGQLVVTVCYFLICPLLTLCSIRNCCSFELSTFGVQTLRSHIFRRKVLVK